MNTFNTDWAYYLGQPAGTGVLKARPEDFIVTENLGYALSGEGEHVFLWIEKQGLNTAFVAEQLAKHTGLPLRQVTYAGRKDKHAVTRQWIGLHAPKGLKADPAKLGLEGFKVLEVHRHHKKLKVGQLQGNHFAITLRDIDNFDDIERRLMVVRERGVPNYFGDQRFGVMRNAGGETQMGGTLSLGMRMVDGETIRNRNKRNMAISALRSALFNHVVSQRIADDVFDKVCIGDACALAGSNSFFVELGDTQSASQQRYDDKDLAPTAPLPGSEKSSVQGNMLDWEITALSSYTPVIDTLVQEGLVAARRAIKIWPKSLEWQRDHDKLQIQFGLPAGCFATSVLRECVQFQPSDDSGND